jgi:hypothetical protein
MDNRRPDAAPSSAEAKPIDILLFCPNCAEQHIDEAKPDICETCGFDVHSCKCGTFTAWLNPPHKSHRCEECNHVWRPADVPTNGVRAIQTKGSRDGNPKPRYFLGEARITELEAKVVAATEREAKMFAILEGAGYNDLDELNDTLTRDIEDCRRVGETIGSIVESHIQYAAKADARAEAAEALKAENAKLRAALEQVEWVYKSHVRDNSTCPWCDGDPNDGHKPDCVRQAALRQEEGEVESE